MTTRNEKGQHHSEASPLESSEADRRKAVGRGTSFAQQGEGWKWVPGQITEDMHAAAPRIEGNATESKGMGGEQQQGVPMTGVAHEHLARVALRQTRDCLEKANRDGLLADTIWFDSACTLFDHIDMVLEEISAAPELPAALTLTCRHSKRSDCALFGRASHE